jgi:hypothetical protein
MGSDKCPKCGDDLDRGELKIDSLANSVTFEGKQFPWGQFANQARMCPSCGYLELYIDMNKDRAEHIVKRSSDLYLALRSGPLAPARVLAYTPLGYTTKDGLSLVAVELEVQPPAGPKFTARVHGALPPGSVSKVQPGQTVSVWYNPNDLTQVVLAQAGA